MELIGWLDFSVNGLGEDTPLWGSCPHPSVLLGMRTSSLYIEMVGQGILIMHHSAFSDVFVDEVGSREMSTKYILITFAALKEFPQIIISS